MAHGYRIGVIVPHMDGEYYGRLLPCIQQVVRERGSQLYIIQITDDDLGVDALADSIAFDLVDAWILILPVVRSAFLELLGKHGKPLVCIGFKSPFPHGFSIFVDNRIGMKKAVEHLIEHGHREIAFIGNTDQYDLYERYLGYRDALEQHRLPFDERRVIMSEDNLLDSGIKAAELLLQYDASFTAIVTNTDLNALGVMDCLHAKGYSVPADYAVIGFDDIHQAEGNYPTLTTVRQPFEMIAGEAVQQLFDGLEGRKRDVMEVSISSKLMIRTSCGCSERIQFSTADHYDQYLQTLSQNRSSLRLAMSSNYRMTKGLISATKEDEIHISKLFWNLSHWGCLALWEEDEKGEPHLIVRQTFSRRGDAVPPEGESCEVKSFPPTGYLPPGVRPGGEEVVIIHPIKSDYQNLGYIALAGPLDPMNNFVANDLSRHSFTILAVALERQLLFNRIRSIAEKLEIVSRMTNDGIWDWDLVKNKVEWNVSARKILGEKALRQDPKQFLNIVHPEDWEAVRLAFMQPYQKDQMIEVEFRYNGQADKLIWLYLVGEIIWSPEGRPIRIIGSITDITEKKNSEARIIQLAYQDALTGLPNRLLFKEQLQAAMDERMKDGKKLAVMMIDLDRFKIVNDTLGHQMGDTLLQNAAQGLKECVGEQDIIARLGGDEFIVLLSKIEGLEEVSGVADRMLRVLTNPFLLENQQFYLSASIGACLYPMDGADADSLIKFADLAMYHTKEKGGNCLAIYTPALSSKRVERFNMETGLRYALERNELMLYFQPQVSLSTGKIYGAETLIRWNSPEGLTIQPGEFIPLAEETGLIIPIGQWVLEQACRECKRWIHAGMPSLVISVNISAQQFQQINFPDIVRRVLQETGIEPFNLCLEITEHTAVRNMEHSLRMLGELVAIGVKIAIDDFGIGQSSLLWLKKLPVHIVKIDPSFILNMIEDSDDDAIAKAVIEMSHSLGLSVTAEGVETEKQLKRLQQLQCDRIQGFYTGRPMTSDQFIAYFLEISSWME